MKNTSNKTLTKIYLAASLWFFIAWIYGLFFADANNAIGSFPVMSPYEILPACLFLLYALRSRKASQGKKPDAE